MIAENDAAEMKYDRDSVVTVIAKEPIIIKRSEDDDVDVDVDVDVNTNYSSDVESEIELPIELNDYEDNDTLRKSDIIIEDEAFIDDNVNDGQNIESMRISSKLIKKSIDAGDNNKAKLWNELSANKKSSSADNNLANFVDGKVFDKIIEDKEEFKGKIGNSKVTSENDKSSFDKAKLLAAMKAIDDNENIEFIDQKARRNSASNRLQITENLYRGVPTHSKKKNDIMKELFSDAK